MSHRFFCSAIYIATLLQHTTVHAEEMPWSTARKTAIQAHTEFLASDLLEGRAPASRGHELAAAYVAAQFLQYGLTPAGDAPNGYLQSVPLLEATAVLPGSTAVLHRAADANSLNFEYGRDFLPSADFLANTATWSAPLAFVGFGISAPELHYDDLTHTEVQDHIAVVLANAPHQFSAAQRAYYALPETKYANLIHHGARGVIIVHAPELDPEFTWERAMADSWIPAMRRLDHAVHAIDAYPELKMRFHFNAQAAAELFVNAPYTFEQVIATALAGESQGFLLPGTLDLSSTTGLRQTDSTNVVGIIPGTETRLNKECILLTAHLDHLGRGPAVEGDNIYNGAQDNASGVAILLETARIIARAKIHPKRCVAFAAVTASNKGGLGVEQLLLNHYFSQRSIIAGLTLDTPLPLTRTRDFIALGTQHSSLGTTAATVAQAQSLELSTENTPHSSPFGDADTLALAQHKIPALSIKSGRLPRNRRIDLTALKATFLTQHQGQPSDDSATLPLDYEAATELVTVVVQIVHALAEAEQRPHWYRDSMLYQKYVHQ